MSRLPATLRSRITIRDTLVAVARDPVAAADRLRLLDPGDLGMVLAHGTAQRLGTSLVASLHSASLPVPTWLEAHRFDATTQRARIMSGLARVAPALRDARIPWAVLKGPVTAASFDTFEMREFSDLDILVPGDRLAEVLEALGDVGIDDQNHNWGAYVRHGVAEFPVFVAGTPIDLHWHLIGLGKMRRRFAVNIREILDRRYTTWLGGVECSRLDVEDHLMHVALHASLSGAHHIGLLRDVHEVVRSSDLDWDELASRALRFGVAPLVGHVLDRSRHILGTPVPPGVPDGMAPRSTLAFRRWLDNRVHPWGDPEQSAFSGFIISASRSGFVNSAARTGELLRESAAARLGRSPRWSAYDPDGLLYWKRHSGDAHGIENYLAYAERQA